MTALLRRLCLPLLCLLTLSACSPGRTDFERKVLRQYARQTAVQDIVLVQCGSGSDASVRYYRKDGRRWALDTEGSALIGKNGLGKTREGDAKTPEGDFGVLTAFGILPDPGTALPWLPVTESTFACDEEGPWYNRIIDTAATHHPCKGEDMFHTAPEYNYGMALDYTAACRYPDGSAIFFHCKGAKAWTSGCIAVDEDLLRHILTTCHPGLRVITY